MTELTLLIVIGLAGLPNILLVIAGLVLAVVILVGAVLLFRSSGKKGAKAATGSGTSDWQRQTQQNAPGAWNPQSGMPDAGWGQQSQVQQPGGWGAPPSQSQQPGGWGAPGSPQQQQASPWGTQSPGQQQQASAWGMQSTSGPGQQPSWGMQNAASQQPAASSWGNPAQGPAQQSPGPWGNQPWEAASPAPSTQQDPWSQQQAPTAQPDASSWNAGAQQGQPPQQAQTAYGGGSGPGWGQSYGSGQQAPADPWGAPASAMQPQYPAAGFPPTSAPAGGWQQGGSGQMGAGVRQPQQEPATQFGNNDDRTMLRAPGPQTGLGIVRVEEGKEPGRVYEIRKDALSIGRSRESDIFLEDLAVSRLHASVVSMGNGNYALKDEGSANGTKVNGQIVNKYQTLPLQEGDKIQLGQTVLVFARR